MDIPETAKEFSDSLELINTRIKKVESKLSGIKTNLTMEIGNGMVMEWDPQEKRIMIKSWNDYRPLFHCSIETRVNSLEHLNYITGCYSIPLYKDE